MTISNIYILNWGCLSELDISYISAEQVPVSTTNDPLMILNKHKIYTNNKSAAFYNSLSVGNSNERSNKQKKTNQYRWKVYCLSAQLTDHWAEKAKYQSKIK